MTQDDIFQAYYTQYRVEADVPSTEDDEYKVFVGLANEGINRWSNYDNTFWKELWQTAQLAGDGDLQLVAGQNEYECPGDMRIAGGRIRIYDDTGATRFNISIIEPQEAQFKNDNSFYAYFTGDPNNGFTLTINGEITTDMDGLNLNYIYYRKPDLFVIGAGNTTPQMSQPYFIVHRALANRFRGSRNPYYQSAKNDAEDILKTMQLENNSGTWDNPWKLADNSTGRFGA